MDLNGRRMILTDEEEITQDNILKVLGESLPDHYLNYEEMDYLYNYYCGRQPILMRTKDIRPEICNKIVVNRANEIVTFKSAYLMGTPVQYVSLGENTEGVNDLNNMCLSEEMATKNKELADWLHICGIGYKMALPKQEPEEDESPFEIYIPDPRYCFVVHNSGLGKKPLLGVKYMVDKEGKTHYYCYSKDWYFKVEDKALIESRPTYFGVVPIVEYPLNLARIGSFENVITLIDAINTVDSNRLDGLEQFIQALLLFHNTDISEEDMKKLPELGGIKYKDIDPQFPADIKYIVAELSQTENQVLVDHLYQTILTICGMPSTSDGSTSDSSNNGAVILRNGWQSAEARAADTEMAFKKSERQFIKLLLSICKTTADVPDIKLNDIDIRFTRKNYENILQKAEVLDMMLNNDKIHPKLAFEHSGMFVDADRAYTVSEEWRKKNADTATADDDSGNPQEGEQSGIINRTGEDSNNRDQEKTEDEG